ncbi:MAG: hypothetical protein ABSG68_02165 [Thermoguttaceae bacterium]|jgi:hypothetical protein
MKVLILGLSKSGTTALAYKIFNSLPRDETTLLLERCRFVGAATAHVVAKVLIDGYLLQLYPADDYVIPPAAIDLESFAAFDMKILIVRDPKDRAVSAELYRLYHEPYCTDEPFIRSVLNALRQKEAAPDAIRYVDFFKFMEDYARWRGQWLPALPRFELAPERFQSHDMLEPQLVAYLGKEPGLFVVHYEDMIDGNLANLEQYLDTRLGGSSQVDPYLRRVERTKAYGDFRNWFVAEDIPYFQFLYRQFVARFPRYDDWTLNPVKTVRPEYASQYVLRIVNEARGNLNLPPISVE